MKTQVEFRSSKFPPYGGSKNRSIPACGANVWPSTRLTEAMQQILSADPEIKEVVWKGPT